METVFRLSAGTFEKADGLEPLDRAIDVAKRTLCRTPERSCVRLCTGSEFRLRVEMTFPTRFETKNAGQVAE
jgi:hypothetical protein